MVLGVAVNLVVDCPPTHRGARITWCGEAPGEDECWKKQGFVGKAGEIQQAICLAGGTSLDADNLTNVSKRRPPGNDFKTAFYTKVKKKLVPTAELLEWYEELRRELLEHRPNVVVACGNEALKALTGLELVSKRQGSVYESTLVPGLKVVAMVHPSAILHGKAWQQIYTSGRIVEKVVMAEAKSPSMCDASWTEITDVSVGWIEQVFADAIKRQLRWVIDIETRGGGIACVGVGFSDGKNEHTIVVPIETTTGPYYPLEDEARFWALLQQLSDHNPNLVVQNGVFDFEWLMDYGFVPANVLMDTMTAHHLMYAELPKALGVLNYFYPTGIAYYKDEGKTWGKKDPDEATWKYCAKDLVSELRISYAEEAELRERKLWDVYQNETMPTLGLALEMQRRGFDIDDEGLKWTQQLVKGEHDRVHEELVRLAGHEVNIGSPKQVPALLYQQLGFPKMYGKSNADEDVLVVLKSWLAGQKPLKHSAKCRIDDPVFLAKPCKHKDAAQLETMRKVLECVMRERKLLKARSSYLADHLYTEV